MQTGSTEKNTRVLENKKRLLELLRARGRRQSFPLSLAQRRLWFLAQLDPANTSYHMFSSVRLEGKLQIAALRQSLSEIVRRHGTLRTRFEMEAGEPVQVVSAWGAFELGVVDIRRLAADTREAEAIRILREQAERPFMLDRGPLLRAHLLWLGEGDYLFILILHHIISDGWSQMVFLRELSSLYDNFVSGRPSDLAEVDIQYTDYAVWQRGAALGNLYQSQSAYWRKQLKDLEPLRLPADRPRPLLQRFRGATRVLNLDSTVAAGLRTLVRERQATLYMILLAGFAALLYRYTGQEGIAVGTTVANRNGRQTEDLIGFFVNMIVLRVRVRSEMTFFDLIEEVKNVCLEGFQNEQLPFDQVVEELQPQRDVSRHPLFQVTFQVLRTSDYDFRLRGVRAQPAEVPSFSSKFDWTADVHEHPDGLQLRLEYNTDLFDAATIDSTLVHYATLLAAATKNGYSRVSELQLLSDDERRVISNESKNTETRWASEALVPDLIRRQAARRPDSVALVCEEEAITYRELVFRSEVIARRLIDAGVEQGSVIGVSAERSIDLVLALLGIWFAGAAYHPLDPALPLERLQQMVVGTGAAAVLADPDCRHSIADVQIPLIEIQGCYEVGADKPPSILDRQSLAYLISTSGSTGTPKSVMIGHGALKNHMEWMQSRFPLSEHDAVLQKTPFSFDASVWEFWAPLIAGARVVIARPGGHADPGYLVATLQQHSVTILQVVPAQLQMILEEGLVDCGSLRRLFCGGGVLTSDLAHRFQQQSSAELINLYGPTEATIDTAFWCVGKDFGSTVPIGRPVANTQLYVLDAQGELMPAGMPGELNIAGESLAWGYRNDPLLTAKTFVPNSFSGNPGARMYRTGDLCRARRTRELEFISRIDHQVKLAGYRFELGEIEHTLLRSPDIRACVVELRQDAMGRDLLTAYVVPAGSEKEADPVSLRALAKSFLPEYMIPARWVILARLPLSPHGKVDRKRLPSPDSDACRVSLDYVPPQNEQQRMIAAIWMDLLRADRVGVQDNFFEAGGHSLLLPELSRRLTQVLGRNVPLLDLFRYPTIASFAEAAAGTPPEFPEDDTAAERLASGQNRRDLRRQLIAEAN